MVEVLHTLHESKGTSMDFEYEKLKPGDISINQADTHERNEQILLMRRIYQRAARLEIWLGDEYDDSKRAIQMITLIAKKATLYPWDFRDFLESYTMSSLFPRIWPSVESSTPIQVEITSKQS